MFFLVSEDDQQCYFINIDAGSRIKMHSVPCNECSGLVLAVQAVISFIMTHYEDMSSKIRGTLQVSFQIDSSALASWMSPHHLHKNVFVRNSCTKIDDLCKDASADYDLQIDFSHIAGVGNCGF